MTSEGAPKIKPGDVVGGKYRVEGVLGEGGMGVVLAAHQIDLARSVALKVMSAGALAHTGARARFLREARASAAIESDHAVRVLDTGELEDGVPYMTMERLDGVDLSRGLRALGVFPVGVAVRCVLEAAAAIGEAHARGIVHRDLKPSNLFVARRFDGQERVVVLDFGISKAVSEDASLDLTATSDTLGSPFYMSPEQIRSMKTVDARTDVWSLGIVLYELLVGRPPWNAPSVTAVAAMIVADTPASPRSLREEIPAELDAIICRCLEKRPDDRFAGIAELRRALTPLASTEPLAILHALRAAGGDDDAPDSRAATELALVTDDRARRAETTEPRAEALRRGTLPRGPVVATAGVLVGAIAIVAGYRAVTPAAPVVAADAAPVAVANVPCVETGRRTYRRLISPRTTSLVAVGDHALLTQVGPWIGGGMGSAYLDVSLPLRPDTVFRRFTLPYDLGDATIALGAAPIRSDVGIVASITGGGNPNTRFTEFGLDPSGAPAIPIGAHMVPHASDYFTMATARELGLSAAVSTGTGFKSLRDAKPVGRELRVVGVGRVDVDVPIPLEGEGASWVFGADGRKHAYAIFRHRRDLGVVAISPTMTGADVSVASPTFEDNVPAWVITQPDDTGLVAWRSGGALVYRAIGEGAKLSEPETVGLGSESGNAVALGGAGDRAALVWIDPGGQGHYGFFEPDLKSAVRAAFPVRLSAPIAAVSVGEENVWIATGLDVQEVVTLRCAKKQP